MTRAKKWRVALSLHPPYRPGDRELESKRRIEQRSFLGHLRLTRYAEELKMLDYDQCWAALERRDGSAAGNFFYGVRTTGVYCRPGCTSRLPLRKNTTFFETTEEAEAAGLRPCKRCRPAEGSPAERHLAAVRRACALLQDSDAMPSLAELADAAGISRFHFHRVFKQITGATPR